MCWQSLQFEPANTSPQTITFSGCAPGCRRSGRGRGTQVRRRREQDRETRGQEALHSADTSSRQSGGPRPRSGCRRSRVESSPIGNGHVIANTGSVGRMPISAVGACSAMAVKKLHIVGQRLKPRANLPESNIAFRIFCRQGLSMPAQNVSESSPPQIDRYIPDGSAKASHEFISARRRLIVHTANRPIDVVCVQAIWATGLYHPAILSSSAQSATNHPRTSRRDCLSTIFSPASGRSAMVNWFKLESSCRSRSRLHSTRELQWNYLAHGTRQLSVLPYPEYSILTHPSVSRVTCPNPASTSRSQRASVSLPYRAPPAPYAACQFCRARSISPLDGSLRYTRASEIRLPQSRCARAR